MFLEMSPRIERRVFGVMLYMWREIFYTTLITTVVYIIYEVFEIRAVGLKNAVPLGVVGTALAIFLGFRNNSAYDRWWEGRKIWGGIVNTSRTFAAQVMTYVTDHHIKQDGPKADTYQIQKELIYRHLAYINALRLHLRKQPEQLQETLSPFLPAEELQSILQKQNKPTQINFNQSQRLKDILKDNLIEDFRLYEMMHSIESLYTLQGMCERIKNTPFPVYYSMFTRMFLYLFVLFLPLSSISIFRDLSTNLGIYMTWMVIPVSVLTACMLAVIERTSRTTENPFENYFGDVPMTALCRTIEIDLREMLGEAQIPSPIQPETTRLIAKILR